MPNLRSLALDLDTDRDGRVIENYRGSGLTLRVARWGNPEFDRLLAERLEKWRGDNPDEDPGEISEEEWAEMQTYAAAHGLLRDVYPLTDEAGNAIKYTPEIGVRELGAPDQYQFRADVFRYAQEDAAYRAKLDGDAKGNS